MYWIGIALGYWDRLFSFSFGCIVMFELRSWYFKGKCSGSVPIESEEPELTHGDHILGPFDLICVLSNTCVHSNWSTVNLVCFCLSNLFMSLY